MSKKLAKIGDIIRSEKFSYGYRESRRGIIFVDGETKSMPVICPKTLTDKERASIYKKTGKIPPKVIEIQKDYGAYNKSRGSAKFVVESALMTGGTGPGAHDPYPDGWEVIARRLNQDGSYNRYGELIQFYLSGCFKNQIDANDVEILGNMKDELPFICKSCGSNLRE